MKNKIMKWKRYKIASVLFISIFLILAISAIAGFFILNQSNQKNIVTEKYCAYAGLFALVFAFLGGIFYELKKNKMIEIVLSGKEVYFSDIDNLNFSDSEYIPEARFILIDQNNDNCEIAITSISKDKIILKTISNNNEIVYKQK